METAAYKLAELKAMLKDGQTDIPTSRPYCRL